MNNNNNNNNEFLNRMALQYMRTSGHHSPSACLVHEKILTEDKILIEQRDRP